MEALKRGAPNSRAGAKNLQPEEQNEIWRLRQKYPGVPVSRIAKQVGRSSSTVGKFLKSVEGTESLAGQRFRAEADAIARRVIAEADTDQGLEILDRLDVLPRKRSEGGGGVAVQVVVGMPGAPALRPPGAGVLPEGSEG